MRRSRLNDLCPRIIGGRDVSDKSPYKYPYQISLRISNFHTGSGSIIDNYNILTAAHCVQGKEDQLHKLTVHAGTNSLNEQGEVYNIESIIIHKNFEISPVTKALINDIALLHLKTPITYKAKVQPITLSNDNGLGGKPCVLSGWGSTRLNGPNSIQLQEINLIVCDQQKCKTFHSNLGQSHICTMTKPGERAYKGDSGGPLVANNVQIGIVSFGCPLAPEYPDVYTRVSSFVDWIDANKKK